MISVIIPVYNVEKYLARCIESVLSQTYTDMEILCVDDCGKDASMEIAEQYAVQFPDTVRIIRSQKNVGLGGARDKGIAHAAGRYLMFVDSDDYIEDSEYLEKFLSIAEADNADIVMGGYSREENGSRKAFPGRKDDPYYKWFFVSACAKLYRKEFLNSHDLDFRGVRTYEDAPFWYRCLSKNPKCAVLEEAGYIYCANEESITKSRKADRTGLFEEYLKTIRACREEIGTPGEGSGIFQYCLLSAATVILLYNGRGCGRQRMKELYHLYDSYIRSLGEHAEYNSCIGLHQKRSEPVKNRMATAFVMYCRRVHLDKFIFMLVAQL